MSESVELRVWIDCLFALALVPCKELSSAACMETDRSVYRFIASRRCLDCKVMWHVALQSAARRRPRGNVATPFRVEYALATRPSKIPDRVVERVCQKSVAWPAIAFVFSATHCFCTQGKRPRWASTKNDTTTTSRTRTQATLSSPHVPFPPPPTHSINHRRPTSATVLQAGNCSQQLHSGEF
jgi:hypothetical protein